MPRKLTSTPWAFDVVVLKSESRSRMSVPEANPTYSLTAALAITFPFNISLGIPLFFEVAKHLHA